MTLPLDRTMARGNIQIDISKSEYLLREPEQEKGNEMARRLRCVQDPGIVELAEDLKLLSDPNRLRILCLLLKGERCVCEVERELGISQQLASHHLAALRERGFLASRREGTSTYYSVERDKLERTTGILLTYLGTGAAEPGAGVGDPCCAAMAPGRTRRRKQ